MARRRILEVFNRYAFYGGEEKIADQIAGHLAEDHEVQRCHFDSREWMGPDAPGRLTQARRLFYNEESRARFEAMVDEFRPDLALFHNVFPVGSPSLYHAAQCRGIPVMQYVHNFRPFSIGGSLFVKGRVTSQALQGNPWPEILRGAWQGSVLKSFLMAMSLRRLRRTGWLDQVKVWVCISQFMQEKFVEAGLPGDRLAVLRHAWQTETLELRPQDDGAYLFLGRLVEEKGIKVLLHAWEILTQSLGDAAPMLWIAGEGPLEPEVRAAAGRNPKVQYLGLLAGRQKQHKLAACRALVVPSVWWEPLGLVVYEAYNVGKPVLAAQTGGLTETVSHGRTGLLYDTGDAAALAAVVRTLEAMDHQERHHLGQAGRQWLLQQANVEAWKTEMGALIEKTMTA